LIPWIRIWVQDPEDGIPDSQSIFWELNFLLVKVT
jgi:hypothetical protein